MNAQRVPFESSCITAVSFSALQNVLHIEFRNGLAYEYLGVPVAVYQDLIAANSKGAFVTRFIRGHFPYRRTNPGDLTQ